MRDFKERRTAKQVLKVPEIGYKEGRLLPRCSKASVKAVSQAKSKESLKTLVSCNQMADEDGVGSIEWFEPQEGDIIGMRRSGQDFEGENLMFLLSPRDQVCVHCQCPWQGSCGLVWDPQLWKDRKPAPAAWPWRDQQLCWSGPAEHLCGKSSAFNIEINLAAGPASHSKPPSDTALQKMW